MSGTTESATVSENILLPAKPDRAGIIWRTSNRIPPGVGSSAWITRGFKGVRVSCPGYPARGSMTKTGGEGFDRPRRIARHQMCMTKREPAVGDRM